MQSRVEADRMGTTPTRMVHGNLALLKQALFGLVASTRPLTHGRIVLCYRAEHTCGHFIVADHIAAVTDIGSEFFAVDATTDLAQLSTVTRERLIPLLYAAEVAHSHGGILGNYGSATTLPCGWFCRNRW